MSNCDTEFRNAVEAYVERPGMSPSRLGREALKDASFVFRLRAGRKPCLDTVDKVLVAMGEAPIGPAFRDEVEAFLEITGVKRSELGGEVTGNRSFAAWLLKGGSPELATVDRTLEFMAENTTPAQRRAIRAAVEDRAAGRTRDGGGKGDG